MANQNIVIVTADNFKQEVTGSGVPVIVDFWAVWCSPCMMLSPIIDELADDYMGIAKVCKVNVDNDPMLAVEFNVLTIPTVIVFKDGAEVGRQIGIHTKEAFAEMIDKIKNEQSA